MKIIIGSDQNTIFVETIKSFLEEKKFDFDIIHYKEKQNWAKIGLEVGSHVRKQNYNEGILLCSSGTGMTIAANKVKGCRAALCFNKDIAEIAKYYNHANILVIPILSMTVENLILILEKWFSTPYGNGEVGIALDILHDYELAPIV